MIRNIYRQIHAIIYESGFGIVEEIRIDLRHKLFDSSKFEIPEALFKTKELFTDGPSLSFPWTEISKSFRGPNRHERLETSSRKNDFGVSEYKIEKGDRLFVNRIDLIDPEERLRGCNVGRRQVYFSLKKKGEDVIEIKQPLLLRPKNEIWEIEFSGNYYSAIKGRITNYFEIDDANGIDHVKEDDSLSYRALRKLSGLIRLWGYNGTEVEIKADGIIVLPTCSSEEEHDKTNIWLTINDAVALGYLWAKSEDQRNQALLEQSAAQKSAAGHLSGDSREEDAVKWRQVFQARVEELWTSATKKPTRKKMIEIISNDTEEWNATRQRLNLPDAAMPGDESLRKEIPTVMRMIARTEGKGG